MDREDCRDRLREREDDRRRKREDDQRSERQRKERRDRIKVTLGIPPIGEVLVFLMRMRTIGGLLYSLDVAIGMNMISFDE